MGIMQDKRVLVTGSGTGIGREVALEFAREGAAVALHYAHSEPGARSAVEEVLATGGRAEAFHADLRSVQEAPRLVAEAVGFLGGLDVLVNNAGITMNRPFEEVTEEQFDTLYHVNVRAMFFVTQSALPSLRERGTGVIVNMTSVHAFEGCPQHSVYAGTKGAIASFTRALAIELAPQGVRVNAIAPGAIEVENYYKAMPDFNRDAVGQCVPVGFVGQPLDIAKAAVFLSSDGGRYILGQTLVIDGGTTSWLPFNDGFRKPMNAHFGVGYVPGL